ncbi:hypothetical protein D3C79_961220 [compost metagenome]
MHAGAVMLKPSCPTVARAAISDWARKNTPTEACGMVSGMMMPVRAPAPRSRKRPNIAAILAAIGEESALVTFPLDMSSYWHLNGSRDSVLFCKPCPWSASSELRAL